jgi:DNA-binding transcriptional regulator YhcF (GntR family)
VSEGDVNQSVWGESGVVIDGESLIPAYVQAAYLMRGFLIARQLPVGSLLPSEASLQARWGISRDTARKAYAVLDESGLTETRRAVGHLVKRLPKTEYVQAPPGSRVTARPPTAQERREVQGGVPSGVPVIIVEEPGKAPAVYEAASTVIFVLGHHGLQ